MQCPSCSAEISDTASTCDSCGSAVPSSDMKPESKSERGWGGSTNSFECNGCGAQTVYTATEMTIECPYCGSQQVIETEQTGEDGELVRPEYVIPFKIEKEKTHELFREWISGLWFAPNDLSTQASADKMRGVYLPFWSYDVRAQTWYNCQVGYTRKVGDETRTDWRPHSGWHSHEYDDVLVCCSKGINRDLVEEIEPFDMTDRKPYDMNYLSGWEAERYAIDEDQAWKKHGKSRVIEMEKAACEKKARSTTGKSSIRSMNVDVRFSGLKSSHLLLPVYISAFRYNDEVYRFLINGQTGEVQGQRPYSWIKIAIFVAVILAIIAVIIFVASSGGS